MTHDNLKVFAKKYIWWKTPDIAIERPDHVLAQVMNLGTFEDIVLLSKLAGNESLIQVLKKAEPGWFSRKSWNFWHYKLGLSHLGEVPPIPQRIIP